MEILLTYLLKGTRLLSHVSSQFVCLLLNSDFVLFSSRDPKITGLPKCL